ncbi:MAG: hypothetical protein FJ202_09690 [Gemmatimonadetes bacterium]|nr:hypothetical protein [Gemmatimonadota bacterium]
MSPAPDQADAAAAAAGEIAPTSRRVAIGCVMAFLGMVSGGMIGVLVAKGVAFLTRAPSCPGIPTCDWYIYWGAAAAFGAVSLPWLVVRAMSRPRKP